MHVFRRNKLIYGSQMWSEIFDDDDKKRNDLRALITLARGDGSARQLAVLTYSLHGAESFLSS